MRRLSRPICLLNMTVARFIALVVLSRKEAFPLGEGSLLFPQRLLPLHAMIASCGHSRQTSRAYDRDGVKRRAT